MTTPRSQQRSTAFALLVAALSAGPVCLAFRALFTESWEQVPLAGTFGQLASIVWALIAAALLVASFWRPLVAATHDSGTIRPFQRSVLALAAIVTMAHVLAALVLTQWTGAVVWSVLIAAALYLAAAAGAFYATPILVRDHADAGGFGTDVIGDRFANDAETSDPFANSAEIFFGR